MVRTTRFTSNRPKSASALPGSYRDKEKIKRYATVHHIWNIRYYKLDIVNFKANNFCHGLVFFIMYWSYSVLAFFRFICVI